MASWQFQEHPPNSMESGNSSYGSFSSTFAGDDSDLTNNHHAPVEHDYSILTATQNEPKWYDAKPFISSFAPTLSAAFQMGRTSQFPVADGVAYGNLTGTGVYVNPIQPVSTLPGHMLATPPAPAAPVSSPSPETEDAVSEYSSSSEEPMPQMPGQIIFKNLAQKDKFLVDMRAKGMSYKKIMEKGRFHEKEPTLRGRYRTLTKRKEHRLRKAPWKENDLDLLRQAVHHFTPANPDERFRLPWKKMSKWMEKRGSGYPFAPGTLAKKWAEIED